MSGPELVGLVLGAAVAGGTPILLAGLGELVAERAGVLNLGVEGMMATGAAVGFVVGLATGAVLPGVLAAMAAGALLALVHALPSVLLHVNQVVSGLAVLTLGLGVSVATGRPHIGEVGPSLARLPIPGLADLPVLGAALFQHHALVYLSYLAAPAVAWFLHRTRLGLQLQVAGESPRLLDSSGVHVPTLRIAATVFGGALAGLGGAALSLAETPGFTDGMVAGRGWIALAMVIFAGWAPGRLVAGAWLFGGLVAVQFRAQAFGLSLPTYGLKMLPYLVTIAVLALTARRGSGAPAALGRPYRREERE